MPRRRCKKPRRGARLRGYTTRGACGLGDDLRGLGQRGERDGGEHGAGGEEREELGHWGGSDQATICAAWFRVAKATGANTAQAAIRAKNLVIGLAPRGEASLLR